MYLRQLYGRFAKAELGRKLTTVNSKHFSFDSMIRDSTMFRKMKYDSSKQPDVSAYSNQIEPESNCL